MRQTHVTLLALAITFTLLTSFALAQVNDASTVHDDATQSRLRVGHFVFNDPNVDMLVNGEMAVISDRPLADMPSGTIAPYLYLEPGTYSVAIVPTGKDVKEAIIGPLDVEVVAGHRYTVAMMGQTTDEKLEPLVIDETAELQKVRTDPSQFSGIWFHNVAGVKTISYAKEVGFAGEVDSSDFGVASISPGDKHLCNNFSERFNDDVIFFEEVPNPAGQCLVYELAVDLLQGYFGSYPGEPDETWTYAQSTRSSDLNTLELLRELGTVDYEDNGVRYSFKTFLAAVEKAGLTNMLINDGPFIVYAPSDDAFAALPKGDLDALMADPKALSRVLRYHFFKGYYPHGTMGNGEEYGGYDRTIENLLGQDVHLIYENDTYNIGGVAVGGRGRYETANGSHTYALPVVLMPPTK